MFFAARIGDMHICPMVTVLVPHVGGPITGPGIPNVMIGGMPASVGPGDMCVCVSPVPDLTTIGCKTVLISGRSAMRTLVDTTAHGGRIVTGCPTVLIGAGAMSAGAISAAAGAMEAAGAAVEAAREAAQLALEAEKLTLEAAILAGPPGAAAAAARLAEVEARLGSF